MNALKKLAGLIVALLLAGGVAGLGQNPAETSHNVVVELNSVYAIWVYRPGYPSNAVHILADPLQRVSDDSARLGYFLNRVGENGTRITVISGWTNWYPVWFRCYLKPKWEGGIAPVGHDLQFTSLWLANIWVAPAVMIMMQKDPLLGEITGLILEYEVEVTDKTREAGTTSTGTITYRIEDVP